MRRTLVTVALSLAATAPLAAQGPAAAGPPVPLPSITQPPALDRVLRDYERAWAAGDTVALAALFTADGFVPTRFGWVRGAAAIKATYAAASGPLRLRVVGYATSDTVGYIVGAFGYGSAADTPDRGKFVLALRLGPGGRWLIAADLDAANRP